MDYDRFDLEPTAGVAFIATMPFFVHNKRHRTGSGSDRSPIVAVVRGEKWT